MDLIGELDGLLEKIGVVFVDIIIGFYGMIVI